MHAYVEHVSKDLRLAGKSSSGPKSSKKKELKDELVRSEDSLCVGAFRAKERGSTSLFPSSKARKVLEKGFGRDAPQRSLELLQTLFGWGLVAK